MGLHFIFAASSVNWFTGWKFTGNFTIVGVLCMALLGGLGGGITRDVVLNKVPGALTDPAYVTLVNRRLQRRRAQAVHPR